MDLRAPESVDTSPEDFRSGEARDALASLAPSAVICGGSES